MIVILAPGDLDDQVNLGEESVSVLTRGKSETMRSRIYVHFKVADPAVFVALPRRNLAPFTIHLGVNEHLKACSRPSGSEVENMSRERCHGASGWQSIFLSRVPDIFRCSAAAFSISCSRLFSYRSKARASISLAFFPVA